MTHQDRSATAALLTLIILQFIMLSALYAGVSPHPPVATPLFGIAPFIGAAIAAATAAIVLLPVSTAAGRALSVAATLMGLVSFGPQKYFDDLRGVSLCKLAPLLRPCCRRTCYTSSGSRRSRRCASCRMPSAAAVSRATSS